MNVASGLKRVSPVLLAGIVALLVFAFPRQADREAVSEFGRYGGYSPESYDGYKRLSDYLALPNGTRLAYDLILPTKKGVPAGKPLPALFKYTPYGRAWTTYDREGRNNVADLEALAWYERAFMWLRARLVPDGKILDPLWRTKWLAGLVKSGYAVVVVERPGTGASFGTYTATNAAMAQETNAILDWIATRPWCDGNIGMYGDSTQAQVQFVAASTGNPHLKALFAESTWMDVYRGFMYPGGVYDRSFGDFYVWSQRLLDSAMVTPVDSDPDGSLLAQARAERRRAMTAAGLGTTLAAYPFRDSLTPTGNTYWENAALVPFLERINRSGVPVYLINGWYDPLARENFVIYANLTVPKRLLVRAADHGQADDPGKDVDYAAEAQRWFDRWLKGIDNGITREPPIHYFLVGTDRRAAWRTSDVWPPNEMESRRLYFATGPAGASNSAGKGMLVPTPPTAASAAMAHTVDYTTTTGKKARWAAINWPHDYPDMRTNDAKALSFTGAPLQAAVQVVGHPIVRLWLTTVAPDLDVFAYLERVDDNGSSTYVTEGVLRASHRAVSQAPYVYLGLPYRNHFRAEAQPIPPGQPIELVFDLLPMAVQFPAGSRIRVTIAFADADNFDTPVLDPAPRLHLLMDADHPSSIRIPAANQAP
jgi:uncharacterized protein